MEDGVVQEWRGGRGYKIHLDRAGSCVLMVEVPSTALDMGNEEHHHGNWRASQDTTGYGDVTSASGESVIP